MSESEEKSVAEQRSDLIAEQIAEVLDELLNESLYWQMPGGGESPQWHEMRDAIMAKVFATEHEMGRQELHSEQVRENCQ